MSASTTPTLRPDRASATAKLAVSVDLPTPPFPEPTAMILRCTLSAIRATRTSATPSIEETAAFSSRSSSVAAARPRPEASATRVATPSAKRTERTKVASLAGSRCSISAAVVMPGLLARMARGCSENVPAPLFFALILLITRLMERLGGLYERIALAMAGKRSPWGKPPGDKGEDGAGSGASGEPDAVPPTGEEKPRGPRNPWLPGGGSEERGRRGSNIEDLFKHRGPEGPKRRIGGPGGPNFRMPKGPGGRSLFPYALGGVALVWLGFSALHQVAPREQAVVTTLGKYSHTLDPGLHLTLPWPLQNLDVENVRAIRSERIPDGTAEKLILTGDQNLVDLSYLIRWSIKDLKQYKFQLAEPVETLREVGEAAMRASVAEHELDRVLSGAGRADIEQSVRNRMQSVLDAYRSGIIVQGIEIQ